MKSHPDRRRSRPRCLRLRFCSSAQSRVSAGSCGSGARSVAGGSRGASTSSPATRFTEPCRLLRSITISIRSPSITLPIGPPGERLRRDMADAGAGRDPAETRVGQHRDMLAERQVLQRGGDLDRSPPCQNPSGPRQISTITSPSLIRSSPLLLMASNHVVFRAEDARRTALAINSVGIHYRGVDRSALDNRAAGRQIAGREGNRRSQTVAARRVRTHDHVVGIDAIAIAQDFSAQPRGVPTAPTSRASCPAFRPTP